MDSAIPLVHAPLSAPSLPALHKLPLRSGPLDLQCSSAVAPSQELGTGTLPEARPLAPAARRLLPGRLALVAHSSLGLPRSTTVGLSGCSRR